MATRLVIVILILASVGACGRLSESRLNPFNWFGNDRETDRVQPITIETVQDPRPLVDEVVAVQLDRAPGGAILRAVGLPATQGYWAASLTLDEARTTPTRLIYQFRIAPPLRPERASTEVSRQLVAAEFITDQRLARVREVQVLGARNARSVRR